MTREGNSGLLHSAFGSYFDHLQSPQQARLRLHMDVIVEHDGPTTVSLLAFSLKKQENLI